VVYIANKNGQVACRSNADTLRDLDGVEPELTITDEEFLAAHETVRIIDGEFFLGLTEEEEQTRQENIQIAEYEHQLEQIDKNAMAGCAMREIVLELAERSGLTSEAVDKLKGYEAEATPIRAQLVPILNKRDIAGC
jgi:hypothetical protein